MSASNTLPEVAFQKLVAGVGTPGAGKSYNICGQIAIPVLKRGGQLIVIDPTGAWFGLSLKPDGKTASGLNIAIFGGDHGNMRLTPNMGRAMGELLGREPISAVLDLSGFEPDEQVHFVSEFAKIFLVANKKPVHVIIDEADEFMPQNPHIKGESAVCKGRLKRFVTRGRKRGVRPVILTQRPQEIDKGVLNHSQVLVTFQCIGEHERKSINGYVGANGDSAAVADMLKEMSELEVGQAWVWAPRKPKFLARMSFGKIPVYDSFKEEDEAGGFTGTVPLNAAKLQGLQKALADFEAERKANDPDELRRQIADLQKQLRAKPAAAAPTVDIDVVRIDAFREGLSLEKSMRDSTANAIIKKIAKLRSEVITELDRRVADIESDLQITTNGTLAPPPMSRYRPKVVATVTPPAAMDNPRTARALTSMATAAVATVRATPTGKAPDRIRSALMWWHEMGHKEPTRAQVAFLANYSPKTSGFEKQLSTLNTAGAIRFPKPGCVQLIDDSGIDPPECKTPIAAVRAVLEPRMWRVLEPLTDGRSKSREELAIATNYSDKTSGYEKTLSQMRTLSLIDFPSPGKVQIAEWLR